MKAIVVSYSSLTHKYRAEAEGVPAISRSIEQNGGYTAARIAQELADKYNWCKFNGVLKYRLEHGFLPNGNDVFVFVELPKEETKPDIRRDLRLLLEKYDAQLVARDYNYPNACLHILFEKVGGYPTLLHINDHHETIDSTYYDLSEEAIADG